MPFTILTASSSQNKGDCDPGVNLRHQNFSTVVGVEALLGGHSPSSSCELFAVLLHTVLTNKTLPFPLPSGNLDDTEASNANT